jgi:hypothetical protein
MSAALAAVHAANKMLPLHPNLQIFLIRRPVTHIEF